MRPRPGALVRPALALGSGALLDLAFPPHDLWWLAPLPVAVLTAVCRGRTVRQGLGLGLLHGLGLFLPLLVWTGTIAGAPAWFALALLEAGFLTALGAALAVLTRLSAWPLWVACAWVLEEGLRDRLPFGGFTWGRLAFSQGHTPLTPLASLGGAPLVTFAVAALSASLLACVTGTAPTIRRGLDDARRRRLAWVLVGPVLVLVALLVPTPTSGQLVTVAVVQGNVPRLGLDAFAQRAAVLGNHVSATHELAQQVRDGRLPPPDLVIWPENASDLDPYTDAGAEAAIDGAVRDVGVPVLIGAVTDGPGRFVSNRGIVWDPVTGPGATYVKRHPVPFGEYIPFRSLVRNVTKKVDLVPRDFASGDEPGVLGVGPATVADVICFEVAYDGVVRDAVRGGGRLVVVQTNNATFGRSGETSQQLAMGRLRAVEHGRAVVVAATSGVSAVIAPDGRVLDQSRVFSKDLLVERVPLRSAQTPATRLGALPEMLLALLGAGAVLVGARR
ncbi:MAG: apolipoprotein N-acyltransferase [Actinomycetota bacterium]|nr:apolipoprotein N-acyltransferase [Actinomycetota bacterium]